MKTSKLFGKSNNIIYKRNQFITSIRTANILILGVGIILYSSTETVSILPSNVFRDSGALTTKFSKSFQSGIRDTKWISFRTVEAGAQSLRISQEVTYPVVSFSTPGHPVNDEPTTNRKDNDYGGQKDWQPGWIWCHGWLWWHWLIFLVMCFLSGAGLRALAGYWMDKDSR